MIIKIFFNGNKYYYKEGKKFLFKHNTHGCSDFECFGKDLYYFIDGKLHNELGPAIIHKKEKGHHYYLNGTEYTKKCWKRMKENIIITRK